MVKLTKSLVMERLKGKEAYIPGRNLVYYRRTDVVNALGKIKYIKDEVIP